MGKIQKIREQKKIDGIFQEQLRKKRNKKRLIVFSLIFLVAILVIGGFLFIKHLKAGQKFVNATIQTDKGNIELQLNREAAPNTVDNFVKLAKDGFYDNTTFHRVVENFVIQGGDPLSKDDDPTNDGTGGPDYVFKDEINPRSLGLSDDEISALESQGYTYNYFLNSIPHKAGTISMANSGPNTNGSQFFIVSTQDEPELDGRYTAFGQVISGMDIVQKIEQGDIIKTITIN
jgi:peptidyl-prolyl cis-trans isomerase B (cyclophilin B)